MMKILLLLLIGLFITIETKGQSCLPDGIIFETQAQINSFQLDYPGCSEIEGDVEIRYDIDSLNGLDILTSIGGKLHIGGTNILNLGGLENLDSVGDYLSIGHNDALSSLEGLNGVTYIGGNLAIGHNDALSSLEGLNNLISITGDLRINSNATLTSLTGLSNLTSVGGELWIGYNNILSNLEGLENITEVIGNLHITHNPALISLTGLDNVISVGGYVNIWNNAVLTSLSGLDNVTSVGGFLAIGHNAVLTNLAGLDNLTSIEGELSILSNDALSYLHSLDNVAIVGGNVWVLDNISLSSLSGLDNIDAEFIDNLNVYGNPILSNCAVLSICNFIENPSGSINIYNNTTGCNNPGEVQDSCYWVSIDESYISFTNYLIIHPNPTHSSITIELPTQPSKNTTLTLSNTNGKQLIRQPITEPQTEIDISHLPVGIYIVKLWNDKDVMVQKVIKQ